MLSIAKYASVSMEWLLTGKGPKGLSATAVRKAKSPYEISAPINIVTIAEWKKIIQNQTEAEAYVSIPLISELVAASDPFIIDEKDIEGFAVIYKTWIKRGHTYRCLRVLDNSMHPLISNGFIAAIDLNENDPLKLERQIVAASYEDSVKIRYLILTEKEYILLPHNTAEYRPVVIPRTAPNPIIGKVTWWWGKAT